MRHLVYGAAFVAALAVAAPVWAQGQASPTNLATPEPPPTASAAPTTTENATAFPRVPRPKRHARRVRQHARYYPYYGYYRRWSSPSDHMANQLNRAELRGGWYEVPHGAYGPRPYSPWGY